MQNGVPPYARSRHLSLATICPAGSPSVHLRLDSDVVDWFKARGKGHLTRMNAVLRAYYVETRKHSA